MSSQHNLDSLSDEALSALYLWPEGSSLRLIMLIGDAGTSVGPDGTSHTLSSASDRRVLRAVRKDADSIIVGAASVRSEGWFLPRQGPLLVLSGTGSLPWDSCPAPDRVIVCASVDAIVEHIHEHPGKYLCDGGLTTAHLLDHAIGFTEIALTSHGSPMDALARVTSNPGTFKLVHELTTQDKGDHTEVFSLWRRAEPTKE